MTGRRSDDSDDSPPIPIPPVCECCERPNDRGEPGWIIHPTEGIDLCPECAAALDPRGWL